MTNHMNESSIENIIVNSVTKRFNIFMPSLICLK